MLKKIIITVAVIVSIPIFASTAQADDPRWLYASGRSCPQVCNDEGLFPVAAGIYTGNNNRYYVCAGNAAEEGYRPGFNLAPSWATTCTVGWGNDSVSVADYYCLCHSGNVSISETSRSR